MREGPYGNGGHLALNFRDNGEFRGYQIERGKDVLVAKVDRRKISLSRSRTTTPNFFTALFPALDEANKTDPFATHGSERLRVDRRAGAVMANPGTQPLAHSTRGVYLRNVPLARPRPSA